MKNGTEGKCSLIKNLRQIDVLENASSSAS